MKGGFDGSTKQTNKQVSQATPYAPAQAGIDNALGGLNAWMSNPASSAVYGGNRVADMSTMTRQGLDHYGGGGGARAASDYYGRMLQGGAENPYLANMRSAVEASVMPGINNTFSAAGMSGSTLHQGSLARGLSDGMAAPLFNAYENERGRQMQAAAQLPGVDERIGQRMIEAGQIGEGYTQRNLDAQRQAFDERRMAGAMPYLTALPALSNTAAQFGRNTSTTTSQSKPSLGQQLMGGAMMLGGAFTGNPMMMAGGAGGMMGGGGSGQSLAGGLGNVMNGAPWNFGKSWDPWVQRGA